MKRLPLIALSAVAAAAAAPLFFNPGFLNTRGGGDSPFLLFRLQQLYSALVEGVFPVRWMPDAAYGLGYPFFNYYAALPLYLASVFKLFGASYVLALKLTHLSGFLLAAVAMYGWMRSMGAGRPAAWLAAAAYTFAPFHLANVFVRGDSLNEFFAFGLYPLCLWSARRLADAPSIARALPLALSYAALLFTHNISALIFSPFLGAYILFITLRVQYPPPGLAQAPLPPARAARYLLLSALGLLLGLALTAFFWLPALREGEYGQLAPVTQGYFHYANHFRGRNLVQPSFIFNYDAGNAQTTPFAMGLSQAVLTGLGLLVLGIHFVRTRSVLRGAVLLHPGVFLVFGLLASTFMITRFSGPLWERVPLLPFVQFPWRFLSLQSLFAAAVVGWIVNFGNSSADPAGAGAADEGARPAAAPSMVQSLAALLLSALCILPASLGLRPDFIRITDLDLTPGRLQVYEYFTGNIGTTINYEYLPRWTQPRPYASGEFIFGLDQLAAKALHGEASGELIGKSAARQTWQIQVQSEGAAIAVPLLYWPGWEAFANGVRVPVRPAEGLGWVAFDLPRGAHRIELRLGNTGLRTTASLVSLLALVAALALVQPWRLTRPAVSPSRLMLVAGALSLLLTGLALFGRLLNAAARPVGAATMDFDQQSYLYSSAVTFGNGDVLQGYNYSADLLHPGEQLAVALQWQAASDAVFTLDLVSPAGHLLKLPSAGPVASATGPAEGQVGALIDIPPDIASGMYLLRLQLFQRDLLAPAFTSTVQPRGPLYLRPIRILRTDLGTAFNPEPLAVTASIQLLSIEAIQTDSTAVNLRLHWRAAAPVPANHVLALRLHDFAGVEIAALDVQPTGGMYPTSAWRTGEIVPESYRFELPSGLPPGDYPLSLTLYDAATLAAAGAVTTPVHLSQWSPPPGTEPVHRFSDTLALHEVSLPASAHTGDRLDFSVRWTSLASLSQDLIARWSALSSGGEVVAVEDHALAVVPTSQWAAGALVMGRPSIKLPLSADPGDYSINVQLLDPGGALLSPPVAVGRVLVAASERTTVLPPVQFEAAADFGPIHLAGYDAVVLASPSPRLDLNLVWQAAGTMAADHKYFIHIFDPADETIVVQIDEFPPVPTSLWETGEVVPVAVSLPLDALKPGTVYNIGVGWYDPLTGDRLGERVLLSQGIVKP
jgi:hypothetical protein